MPNLSVILTTYNEKYEFLEQCLDSILRQTYKDIQVLIVLEPNDTNVELLLKKAAADVRIQVFHNDEKTGISGSRNRAIQASTGKYVALIDSDDYCDITRFEKQVSFLDNNPDISVVGSNMILIDPRGRNIGCRTYPQQHDHIKRYFLKTMGIANPTAMTRRQDLEEVGSFDTQFLNAEDLELWLRFLARNKRMHNLQENLVYYRIPDDQFVNRSSRHYTFNYMARKRHGRLIWAFHERAISILAYYMISHVPAFIIERLLNLSIANRIKRVQTHRLQKQ